MSIYVLDNKNEKYSAISVLVIILSLMIYFSFYFNQEKENVINCEAKVNYLW